MSTAYSSKATTRLHIELCDVLWQEFAESLEEIIDCQENESIAEYLNGIGHAGTV